MTGRGRKKKAVVVQESVKAEVQVDVKPRTFIKPEYEDENPGQNVADVDVDIVVKEEGMKMEDKVLLKEEEEDDSKATASKKSKWEPENWQLIYNNIRQMRSSEVAPVDTMGCHKTMEENIEPNVRRFQALLSLMLSSQTKDQVTFAAMDRLKQGKERLNIQKIRNMDEKELGGIIIPVGFWKKKASYIKRTAEILHEKYNDDIPDTIEGLCSLPGVGQKMAHICMRVGWEITSGIGVDTHVHRISNRLKWTGRKETKTPDQTRIALESWVPSDLWGEVNEMLVGFGQTICTPISPKCNLCLNNTICSVGKATMRSLKSKSKSKKNQNNSDEIDKEDKSESGDESKYFKSKT